MTTVKVVSLSHCAMNAARARLPRGLASAGSKLFLGPACATPAIHGRRRQYASRVIVHESLARILYRQVRHCFQKPRLKAPPYDHICQVGDPVLRGQSSPVDPRQIRSTEIQNVVKTMVKVMRGVNAVGCAAPQVGVAKQIMVMEFTEKHMAGFEEEVLKVREVAVFPLKIFINPVVRITDPRVVSLPEGCLSIAGYYANVPRAYGVEITGLNERGQEVSWQTTGYPARIIQHEMDHLGGKLFVDTMDSSTFHDREWLRWNIK